jgi:Hemerythrin HHE cation binding domain
MVIRLQVAYECLKDQVVDHYNPSASVDMNTSSSVNLPGHRAPAVGLESPFEMLVACHERVNRSLELLHRLQAHLGDKGLDEDARQAARDVLRYFDISAPLHHQDEELHVFPPLLQGLDPELHEIVDKLMNDHRGGSSVFGRRRGTRAEGSGRLFCSRHHSVA